VTVTLTAFEQQVWAAALDRVLPKPPKPRRWASPGAMAAELDPANHRTTAALDHIDAALATWADAPVGDGNKLMIFCPPQEGKSQKVSRRTPAWLLTHDPTLRIAIVSYAANKAERWGRQIRRDILSHPELKITLQQDSRAAGRWETVEGGQLVCVGIDGGITGEPVDVLIIDDPVRGRAEAESTTYREAAWDWWESNGSTRLSSRGRVCLMMTRWHEDDLAGRLLKNEPGQWQVVRIPAIAEEGDPLGRAPGEELVSVQNRQPGYFSALEATRSAYVWLSIYMQTPTAAEGMIFKRLWWRYHRPAPAGAYGSERRDLGGRIWDLDTCNRFITVDLAASTKTSADFTVASALAFTLDGDLILLDRARARVGEEQHFDLVRPLADRWDIQVTWIERGMIGTTLIREATTSGLIVLPLEVDTDKVTRALPAADRCKAGRVWLPAGAPWLEKWLTETSQFPVGAHDDQVDTLGHAVRVAVTKWMPPPTTPAIPPPPTPVDELDMFGPSAAPADWMTVPL
jgi:predicted phage terminase large subunit-like protein